MKVTSAQELVERAIARYILAAERGSLGLCLYRWAYRDAVAANSPR